MLLFPGRCSEHSHSRGLINESYLGKGGHFLYILDPSSSACAFLLCNAGLFLGHKLALLCCLNPTKLVDNGGEANLLLTSPTSRLRVAPASKGVCYSHFLL